MLAGAISAISAEKAWMSVTILKRDDGSCQRFEDTTAVLRFGRPKITAIAVIEAVVVGQASSATEARERMAVGSERAKNRGILRLRRW